MHFDSVENTEYCYTDVSKKIDAPCVCFSVLRWRRVEMFVHKIHNLPRLAMLFPVDTVSTPARVASGPSRTMH
jgi:hypothetical protein